MCETGFRVQGSGFRVQGSGYRVQSSGFRVQGPGSRVQASGALGARDRKPGSPTSSLLLLSLELSDAQSL